MINPWERKTRCVGLPYRHPNLPLPILHHPLLLIFNPPLLHPPILAFHPPLLVPCPWIPHQVTLMLILGGMDCVGIDTHLQSFQRCVMLLSSYSWLKKPLLNLSSPLRSSLNCLSLRNIYLHPQTTPASNSLFCIIYHSWAVPKTCMRWHVRMQTNASPILSSSHTIRLSARPRSSLELLLGSTTCV